MIAAFEIVEQLKPNEPAVSSSETAGFILPISERHTRPLAKLEKPEQRAEVWQRVIASTNGQGITAKLVEAEVQRKQAELEKDWITLDDWQKLSEDEQQRILTL